MKKLLVTVNGVRFDVEVEIIEDDEFNQMDPSYLQSIARQSRPATPTTLQQPVRNAFLKIQSATTRCIG
jgi:hypothetical protein